jgi:hypothetical protein
MSGTQTYRQTDFDAAEVKEGKSQHQTSQVMLSQTIAMLFFLSQCLAGTGYH